MQVSTQAIVLAQTKYSDSSIILQLYTKSNGRVPVMVYGLTGKKRNQMAYYQALNLLEVVLDIKAKRQVQSLKEARPEPVLHDIGMDYYKSTQAIFLAEVLTKSLQEEHAHAELFDFIHYSVQLLNSLPNGETPFYLAFLVKLTRYLGFWFYTGGFEKEFFDYQSGRFVSQKPAHAYFLSEATYKNLQVIQDEPYDAEGIQDFAQDDFQKIFATLFKLYDLNIPGFRNVKSLGVLREVFAI